MRPARQACAERLKCVGHPSRGAHGRSQCRDLRDRSAAAAAGTRGARFLGAPPASARGGRGARRAGQARGTAAFREGRGRRTAR